MTSLPASITTESTSSSPQTPADYPQSVPSSEPEPSTTSVLMDTTEDTKPSYDYELPPMSTATTNEDAYWGPPKASDPSFPAASDDADIKPPKAERSPSPTASTPPPASLPPAASRKAAAKAAKKEGKAEPVPIPLISHLPEAGAEAQETFIKLEGNHHQYKSIGRSNQDEDSMICDCSYKHGDSERNEACGEGSDCINRLTQVECLEAECRTKKHCLNQRFTRKQYSPIEVVMTERKGYGLRAADNIDNDAFIYEYIGEVVQQATFMKRMQSYAKDGIRHFYFMMLQREEYIDATKKGDIARFANHSCNPNCYVAKWVVGKRLRMGIFAKRDILKGEELTFNYNVDRYGHQAQPCYCDEPNCVGSIGGKTQTDVGGMDDLYLDALGIADEVEALGLKGNKKKKGKKLGEDFMPILKPIKEAEVAKIVAAVRQATANRNMMTKLLSRVKITEDVEVQKRIMRMHGFNLMNSVLKEFPDDKPIVKLVLEIMTCWPLLTRNKVEDSKVEEAVSTYVDSEFEELKMLAQNLIQTWSGLETAYRIARRPVRIPDPEDDDPESTPAADAAESTPASRVPTPLSTAYVPPPSLFAVAATEFVRPEEIAPPSLPTASSADAAINSILERYNSSGSDSYRPDGLVRSSSQQHISRRNPYTPAPPPPPPPGQNRDRLEAIIARTAQLAAENRIKELETAAAAREAEHAAAVEAERKAAKRAAARAAATAGPKTDADRLKEREGKRKRSSLGGGGSEKPGGSGSSSPKAGMSEEQKEKRLLKMVGEVVVKSMSKYKDQLDHDRFKKYAKECANLIAAKEKKSSTYRSATTLPPLSEEKQAKMKKFTKEFVHKLLSRLKKEGVIASSSSTSAAKLPSPSTEKGKSRDPRQMRLSLSNLSSNGGPNSSSGSPATPMGDGGADDSREESVMLDDIMGDDDDEDMDLDDGAEGVIGDEDVEMGDGIVKENGAGGGGGSTDRWYSGKEESKEGGMDVDGGVVAPPVAAPAPALGGQTLAELLKTLHGQSSS